jgi:fluoride exporter
MTREVLCVASGAVLGALLRFGVTHLSSELSHHHGFPYGTLFVNVSGSLLVGYMLAWTDNQSSNYARLLVATGFCGAFTTFSAFAFESAAYWRDGNYIRFATNILLNNTLSVLAVIAGATAHTRIASLLESFQRG